MRNSTKQELKRLGFKSYRAYCLSEHWRKRRARYFAKHPRKCWICGKKTDIHLHHRSYARLMHEWDVDLVPLCKAHHRGVHGFMKRKRVPLEDAHLKYREWLAARAATEKSAGRRSGR